MTDRPGNVRVHGRHILASKEVQEIRNKILRNEATLEELMDLVSSHEHLRGRLLVAYERARHGR